MPGLRMSSTLRMAQMRPACFITIIATRNVMAVMRNCSHAMIVISPLKLKGMSITGQI